MPSPTNSSCGDWLRTRPVSVLCVALTLTLGGCLGGCSKSESFIFSEPNAHAVNGAPAWGPDGVRIAYEHYPQTPEERANGSTQVWVGTLDSAGAFVTPGQSPAWSPDGTRLAFVRAADIGYVDLATRVETRLTTQGSCFSPSWSPDGVHIAYKVESNGPAVPDDSAGIWMIDVRTLQRRQLLRFLGGRPSWSPRGDRLAISAALGATAPYDEIALIDTLSDAPIRLTSNAVDDEAPAWSPDGSLIAWFSDFRSTSGIWLMNSDGSSQHLLIPVGGYPSWSPDGKFIIYGGYNPRTNVQSLWVAGSDGRGNRELPY